MRQVDAALLAAAFDRVAEHGLAGLDLVALAESQERELADVVATLGGAAGLVRALGRRLDEVMLGVAIDELSGLSVRERLFELIMRRFDAMRPYRAGLARLTRDERGDPFAGLAALVNLERASSHLLDAAGIHACGPLRLAMQAALVAVYARVFRVWLDDASEDLAATMADLDKRLQQAERAAAWLPGRHRREAADAAA